MLKKLLFLITALLLLMPMCNADLLKSAEYLKITATNYEPSPAEAGKYVTIWVRIQNEGKDPIPNAIFTLEPKYPFSFDSSETATKDVGVLWPLQPILLEYKLKVDKDAVEGTNEVKLGFRECETCAISTYHTIQIYVQQKPELEIKSVVTNPEKLKPGTGNAQLSVELTNLANSDAKDVRVTFSNQDEIRTIGSSVVYVGDINAKDIKTVLFPITIDKSAKTKTYVVPLVISYKGSSGNATNITRNIGISISAQPELSVILNAMEPAAYQTGTSDIKVDIINSGLDDATSLLVTATSDCASKITPEKVFVGTLKPDDFDTVDFKITFKDSKESTCAINFKLGYKDQNYENASMEIPLTIDLLSKAEAEKQTQKPVSVWEILGALVVFAVLWKFTPLKHWIKSAYAFVKKILKR